MRTRGSDANLVVSHSRLRDYFPDSLGGALERAQIESLEKEIFGQLITEAANLPTASARVSERLIVIDAAETMELRFELVRRAAF